MDRIIIYVIVFIFGTIIGSFLNVCIYRIPLKNSVVIGRSHCMNCNNKLKWYELVPIISFILLRGKCKSCKSKISFQYPIVEAMNGLFYLAIFYIFGWSGSYVLIFNIIYCMATSTLFVLSIIDLRTHTIPDSLSYILLLLGIIFTIIKSISSYDETGRVIEPLLKHGIGFFAVSALLLFIFYVTQGRGIGGGDVKLMAGAGLLLGWDVVIVAFLVGCIMASVIHPIMMLFKKSDRVLAFGPYLSVGIFVGMLFGKNIISWYLYICI